MTETARQKKRQAYKLGHRAEWLASVALLLKGYRIAARRFKTKVGEVDIIARKGDLIAFVEVKARATERAALEAVTPRAKKRIRKAGEWWVAQQPDHARLSWRCDIVAVVPRRWPKHFKNVW